LAFHKLLVLLQFYPVDQGSRSAVYRPSFGWALLMFSGMSRRLCHGITYDS
jgi:hypothetical protein